MKAKWTAFELICGQTVDLKTKQTVWRRSQWREANIGLKYEIQRLSLLLTVTRPLAVQRSRRWREKTAGSDETCRPCALLHVGLRVGRRTLFPGFPALNTDWTHTVLLVPNVPRVFTEFMCSGWKKDKTWFNALVEPGRNKERRHVNDSPPVLVELLCMSNPKYWLLLEK